MITRIKFCGLTRAEDVSIAVQSGVHALGLVFYPKSPRYVSANQARELLAIVPPFISTVGLFVNATKEQVMNTLAVAPVDLLQFHGDETVQQCQASAEAVQRPYIRALRIQSGMRETDLLECEAQFRAGSCWFKSLLLDSFVDGFGGAGQAFDWSVIPKELASRIVLSGGLTAHNVTHAINQIRPMAVDVSSGIEQARGIKDPVKMRAFVNAVQLAGN